MIRKAYHTQEAWNEKLLKPIICVRSDAWLGDGYYFWLDLEDAMNWGNKSKRNTGAYEIYTCNADCENVLDTVFNEEAYNFWLNQVEKVARNFMKKSGIKPTKRVINQYFKEKGTWNELDGILFQDVPENEDYVLVKGFYYRKRIQLVAYNLAIIHNFEFFTEEDCN